MVGKMGEDNLDGDLTPNRGLVSAIDCPKATCAKSLAQYIAFDARAAQVFHTAIPLLAQRCLSGIISVFDDLDTESPPFPHLAVAWLWGSDNGSERGLGLMRRTDSRDEVLSELGVRQFFDRQDASIIDFQVELGFAVQSPDAVAPG